MVLGLEREAVLAVGVGVFLVAVGLAVVVGMPWQHTGGGAAMVVLRGGGSLLVAVLGAALAVFALRGRS